MRWLPSVGVWTLSCQVLDCGAQGFQLRGSWLVERHPGRPGGQALQRQAGLESAMSAPLTASTACLMRSCAAAAAWSSLRCSASARSRNGRGKTLETPDTAPVPPARTKSPNSMSLPEYTSKSSGTARTYCRTRDVGSPLIFAPATDGIVGQFGELIRGDGGAGAGGVQVDVDPGVTGDGVQPAVVVDQCRGPAGR